MGELCKWVLFGEGMVSLHGKVQEDDACNHGSQHQKDVEYLFEG